MEALETSELARVPFPNHEFRDDGAFVFHHPPKFSWQRDVDPPPQRWTRYSIYVHVPFCRRICTFCTFERKQLQSGSIDRFAGVLDREVTLTRNLDDFTAANLHSVYLGGGTASLLTPAMIRAFLARLRADFGLRSAEVTLECEPATKTRDAFAECRDAGVNRISVGVQAFQDEHLIRLNRAHRVRHSVAMVRDAQSAGFENVHIDLMYGLPGQAMSDWAETMARAVDLGVTHISTYRLIVFPNELLARSINHGELDKTPPPERINDMRLMADERFSAAGYQRYSLTELAKPGFECKYVRTSWDGSDYLGFGPGAYSRNGNTLWEDDVIHGAHERRIDEGRRPTGKSRVMTGEERLTRDIAMGLCLLRVDLGELEARSGFRTDPLFTETIRDCEEAGLLRRDGDVLTLTSDGIRYATEVMKSFTEGTRGKRRLPTPPVLA